MTSIAKAETPLTRRDALALAGLALAWLVAPLALGMAWEFPLSDDWAYARTVQTLLETGRFVRPSWTWIPAMTHTAWGFLFTSFAGFSFETLRWSNVVAGYLGAAGAYVLARRLGAATGVALLLAATYAWNPIHLNLAFTFMTDALFSALCIWSLVFLSHAAREPHVPAVALGTALAVAATLSRQTGLALPAAFAAAVVVSRWRDPRAWIAAVLCAGASLAIYWRSEGWLLETGGSAGLFPLRDAGLAITEASGAALFHLVRHGATTLVCLGWFLSPVVLASPGSVRIRSAAAVLSAALVAFVIWRLHLPLPPNYNMIWDFGLGPVTIEGEEALPHAPAWLWWLLVLSGAAMGGEVVALIASRTLPRLRETLALGDRLVLLAFAAIFLAPHLPRAPFFDRYLVVLIVPLGAWLLATNPPGPARTWRPAAAALPLAALALFGVVGTRDHLVRSQAKWALLHDLHAAGYDERHIAAGMDYNGWLETARSFEPVPGRREDEMQVVVSCAPELPGRRPLRSRSFTRWLPPGTESVYALERDAAAPAPSE